MQTIKDLKHWGTTQIVPRLVKCKVTPSSSYPVEQDLSNDQVDLGISTY
jgi:hypothetical protein